MSPPIAVHAPDFYQNNVLTFTRNLDKVKKEKELVGNLRLLTVVLAITGAVLAYRMHLELWSLASMLVGVQLFILLAIRHAALFSRTDYFTGLVAINRQGIDRMNGAWDLFIENGNNFINHGHPFTSDLDQFGKGSLYQFLSSAKTWSGKRSLASLLDGTAPRTRSDILQRQEAVKELAHLAAWRQEFACSAFSHDIDRNPDSILTWGESSAGRNVMLKQRLSLLIPAGAAAAGLICYLVLHTLFPALLLASLQLLLTVYNARKNLQLFALFSGHAAAISIYSSMMDTADRTPFTAPLASELQKSISGGRKALKQLSGIISMADVRQSPLPWIVANMVSLWDIRCACALARWKQEHGLHIRSWLDALGKLEALSSLAHLPFEHPEWVFPNVNDSSASFSGTGIAHPLIPAASRVANDFSSGSPGTVAIITGSNMSGKSTFLRAVGCNLVLAYAGAPVCADTFSCGIFRIFTSMRTGDDLLSHTSTFYAELLKVKKIVDAVTSQEPLLYLLDELFRGTNSEDRHEGAVALIHHLSKPHTTGLVATHDLALCSLAEKYPHISNYHFRETFTGDNITFDYLLKNGASATRNALYLMRMAGIEVGGGVVP